MVCPAITYGEVLFREHISLPVNESSVPAQPDLRRLMVFTPSVQRGLSSITDNAPTRRDKATRQRAWLKFVDPLLKRSPSHRLEGQYPTFSHRFSYRLEAFCNCQDAVRTIVHHTISRAGQECCPPPPLIAFHTIRARHRRNPRNHTCAISIQPGRFGDIIANANAGRTP